MRIKEDRVKVSVPATTADFGPTHDCLAMACALSDEVAIRAVAGGTQVRVIDRTPGGSPEHWLSASEVEKHPTITAIRGVLDLVGAPQVGVHLTYRRSIPTSVGLGDVEAELLAGVYGAWTILGKPQALNEDVLVDLVCKLGGNEVRARAVLDAPLVLRITGGSFLPLPVGEAVQPVALVPGFTDQETLDPGLLPRGVSFPRYAANSGRSAALVPLIADPAVTSNDQLWRDRLAHATVDDVLEDHRASFSPASVALIRWLRERGHAAFLSGSGPAVVCLWDLGADVVKSAQHSGWAVIDLGVGTEGLTLDV